MEEWTNDDGERYISCDALCVGDYGGASAVGEANIRALGRDYHDTVVRHGAYYSRQLWLPDTEETRAIVEGLERDCALYNEEELSIVEMEWETDAWESWLQDYLLRTLSDDLREWAEDADYEGESVTWNACRSAMESTNTYPEAEYSGVAVDIDSIKDAFRDALESERVRRCVESDNADGANETAGR